MLVQCLVQGQRPCEKWQDRDENRDFGCQEGEDPLCSGVSFIPFGARAIVILKNHGPLAQTDLIRPCDVIC